MSNWASMKVYFISRKPAVLGKELHFEDPIEMWEDQSKNPESYLPCGSEGSLKYITENKKMKADLWWEDEPSECYCSILSGSLRDPYVPDFYIKWLMKAAEVFDAAAAHIVISDDTSGYNEWKYCAIGYDNLLESLYENKYKKGT